MGIQVDFVRINYYQISCESRTVEERSAFSPNPKCYTTSHMHTTTRHLFPYMYMYIQILPHIHKDTCIEHCCDYLSTKHPLDAPFVL